MAESGARVRPRPAADARASPLSTHARRGFEGGASPVASSGLKERKADNAVPGVYPGAHAGEAYAAEDC